MQPSPAFFSQAAVPLSLFLFPPARYVPIQQVALGFLLEILKIHFDSTGFPTPFPSNG